mmetsp:Transcript_10489/g.29478  ORF Transcript_10489/g.29478 Transcript_10489/m.29478 type:complete len:214 (+) Transcript_10489:86-727(+)
MKISAHLLLGAAVALLTAPVVLSAAHEAADAAAPPVTVAANDQSSANDMNGRELWHYHKECCELECKPKCGTDEVENCENYAKYEYDNCCHMVEKKSWGQHTCDNDSWAKKHCADVSGKAEDNCKAHCWGEKECFKVCFPCGFKPDDGGGGGGGESKKKVCKDKRRKCKKKCDRRRLGSVAAGEVADFAEGSQFHRELGSCKKKCKKEYKKCL